MFSKCIEQFLLFRTCVFLFFAEGISVQLCFELISVSEIDAQLMKKRCKNEGAKTMSKNVLKKVYISTYIRVMNIRSCGDNNQGIQRLFRLGGSLTLGSLILKSNSITVFVI